MGILGKKLKFNHGDVIDFDIIKDNRIQAVKEISEDNKGLENLLNVCVDNNIRTHSSCGDRSPRICFIIDDENRDKFINLFTVLDSLPCLDKKIFDIELIKNNKIDKLLLNIRIMTSIKLSEVFFNYIAQILDSNVMFEQNDKFDIMEKFVNYMFSYADHVCLGLEYMRNQFKYDCAKDKNLLCSYDFNLYLSSIKCVNNKVFNYIIDNVDYCFRDFGILECGIVSVDSLYAFVNYINEERNKKGLIKKIKSLF